MKYWSYALLTFGFSFQYIMPIVVFGMVIPYTHGTMEAGLTGAGIVALAIIIAICGSKIKEALKSQPKCWLRAAILYLLFPTAIWCVLGIGLDKVANFFLTLIDYWWFALSFIVVGGIFFVIEETLSGSK